MLTTFPCCPKVTICYSCKFRVIKHPRHQHNDCCQPVVCMQCPACRKLEVKQIEETSEVIPARPRRGPVDMTDEDRQAIEQIQEEEELNEANFRSFPAFPHAAREEEDNQSPGYSPISPRYSPDSPRYSPSSPPHENHYNYPTSIPVEDHDQSADIPPEPIIARIIRQ